MRLAAGFRQHPLGGGIALPQMAVIKGRVKREEEVVLGIGGGRGMKGRM